MSKKKRQQEEENLQEQFREYTEENTNILRKKTIKELIAPSGIDASHIDHLEIISSTKRRSRMPQRRRSSPRSERKWQSPSRRAAPTRP